MSLGYPMRWHSFRPTPHRNFSPLQVVIAIILSLEVQSLASLQQWTVSSFLQWMGGHTDITQLLKLFTSLAVAGKEYRHQTNRCNVSLEKDCDLDPLACWKALGGRSDDHLVIMATFLISSMAADFLTM